MNAFSPAPEFGGRAGNIASYRQEVELWLLVTHLLLNRRAPALALAMDKMPRELCPSLGVGALDSDTGVAKIMGVLRKNLAPDASYAGFRDIVAFFGLRRPRLTLVEYLPRFEMARRPAGVRFPNNGILRDIMLSPLRLHRAGRIPNQKSMIRSITGGDPSLETMKRHMRQMSQPCGVELKQDALVAEDDLFITQQPHLGPRRKRHW